jgi:hypothetical protein
LVSRRIVGVGTVAGMGIGQLKEGLRNATSWWQVARVLVEEWRARPDLADAPWDGSVEAFDAYGRFMLEFEERLGAIDPDGPTATQIELLCEVVDTPHIGQQAAVIDAVDERCHPAFCNDWVLEHDGPFTPQPGELYPVPSWEGPPDWAPSRRPENFVRRPFEFPHVRAYEPALGFVDPVEVVFDPSAEVELTAALTDLGIVATVHPNEEWSELAMSDGASAFPVGPRSNDQLDVLKAGIDVALANDAQVVVLPELAVTEAIANELHGWLVARGCFAVVVRGSFHALINDEPANLSRASVGTAELTHRKMVPFTNAAPGAQPSREGIAVGPRQIRVLIGAGYRFAVVICKDFLDRDVRHALGRAGVNVLAVPAMSASMDSYAAEVDGHVLAAQGVVVVANNPGRRPNGHEIRPAFVFGQPKRGAMHVAGPNTESSIPAPYMAVFRLGDQEAGCVPHPKMLD